VTKNDLSSLRLLGSVGEPINPEAWLWYHRVVGKDRLPIVDTWWQTETGGILVSPLPGATALKPGSATKPLPGVKLQLVDADGKVLEGATEGNLVITDSWPGQMRGVYGDHDRFFATYFGLSGQVLHRRRLQARRGRLLLDHRPGRRRDQRLGPPPGHRRDRERPGRPRHGRRGRRGRLSARHQGPGRLRLRDAEVGVEATDDLRKHLILWVRQEIGPFAAPDVLQWAPGLPKTRSGKIMRRILRKIAENELGSLGDTSTLADPSVVDDLVKNRAKA
jgi:acetyl-CoA synthetase